MIRSQSDGSAPELKRARLSESDSPQLHNNAIVDPFSKWPPELLIEALSYITSLPHKFKLAAVNRKFRNCVVLLLQKERELSLDFVTEQVNGHPIKFGNWPMAVAALCKHTQLRKVTIKGDWMEGPRDESRYLAPVLKALLQSGNLGELLHCESNAMCSAELLVKLLVKCPMLSELKLNVPIRSPRLIIKTLGDMDIKTALQGKRLSEVLLSLNYRSASEVAEVFECLEPHTLRKVDLKVVELQKHAAFYLVGLMKRLINTVWSRVESLMFETHNSLDTCPLETIFKTVCGFPNLTYFSISYDLNIYKETLAEALLSLLRSTPASGRLHVDVNRHPNFELNLKSCDVTFAIKEIWKLLPDMEVELVHGYRLNCPEVILKHGVMSFAIQVNTWGAFGHDCDDCYAFYPNVLAHLYRAACELENVHLEHFQLDKCRVDQVVPDVIKYDPIIKLNEVISFARSAVLNEARDRATVTFVSNNGMEVVLTVNCGHCFNTSCIGCLEV